jgi:hypothetical protein
MDTKINNPFSVTKATDFTDQEIADYWVDFYSGNDEELSNYLNPNDITPKYILGGKGCGKTHLLRYYSFPLQQLRNKNNVKDIIEKEGYIGIIIGLGATSSTRLVGQGISDEQWQAIFAYYIELYVGLSLINVIQSIFTELGISREIEECLINATREKIYIEGKSNFENTLASFSTFINNLKKQVDFQVNNAAVKRKIDSKDLSIQISPGDLFFEFPKLITEHVSELKDAKFIFILDQLETLLEFQKIYINTLIYDKRIPCTFWVGSRTHGFTTRKIKSGEFLKIGSEFTELNLDDIMRENENRYQEFAINLCAKRLRTEFDFNFPNDSNKIKKAIDEYFDDFDERIIFADLNKKRELPHQKLFRYKLKDAIDKKQLIGKNSEVDAIFELYIRDENPLFEKYRILYFYKQWKKTNNIDEILYSLYTENDNFKNKRASKFDNYEEKYKLDFLAQLLFENNLKIFPYTGLDEFIKISCFNPRAFLVILKEIFERAKLNQQNPFIEKKGIKAKTQSLGIYHASKWFYEDVEAHGEDGKCLYRCLNNLAVLFQGIRFSDKPSETSPSTFSYKPEKTSVEAAKFINLSKMHRVLMPVDGRHDKNSERVEDAFQINRMLAPYFNLPISRRGIVPLNESLIETIFNPSKHSQFQTLFNEIISRMNAPFNSDSSKENNSFQAEIF